MVCRRGTLRVMASSCRRTSSYRFLLVGTGPSPSGAWVAPQDVALLIHALQHALEVWCLLLQGSGGLVFFHRGAEVASGSADYVLAGRDGGRRLVFDRMTSVAGVIGAVMGCTYGRCSWFVWSDVASPLASWLCRFAALPRISPGGALPGVLLVRHRTCPDAGDGGSLPSSW